MLAIQARGKRAMLLQNELLYITIFEGFFMRSFGHDLRVFRGKLLDLNFYLCHVFFLIFRKSTLNNITLIDNKFMQTHISAQTIEVVEDPFKTVLYLEYNVDVSVSS